MPKTIALLTIHGMGDTPRDYYRALHDRLKKVLGKSNWAKIAFETLYYQDILQANQEAIFNRMRDQIDWMKLRKFLLYGFSDAATLEYKKEADTSPYVRTQEMILKTLDKVWQTAGQQEIPVVLVAQSLGGQVISNYIWDAQQPLAAVGVWAAPRNDGVAPGSPQDRFRRLRSLKRLYTTGCNIPLFVSGHQDIIAIQPPTNGFKWHNFFDEDDVLGWPLKPLSPSYEALVEDIAVNAGSGLVGALVKSWNPLSHSQYWTDGEVVGHLAATLKHLA